MKNKESNTLNIMDDLNKHETQAQAIVNSLIQDDHSKHIDRGILGGLLWILSDRLTDINKGIEKLQAIAMGVSNEK